MEKQRRDRRLATRFAALAVGLALTASATRAATWNPDDRELRRAIQGEFLAASRLPYQSMDVAVLNGIAILMGSADTILSRRWAVQIARNVRGVRGVVNLLASEPSSRSDAEIRTDIQRGLLLDPSTESTDITLVVKDGVATLDGTVDSAQEKQSAVNVAEGVRGVRGVRGTIRVREARVRSDGDISADVRKRLAWNSDIDDADIDIAVESGQVTLVGEVSTSRERALAADAAWVAGVRAVDASGLETRGWSRDDERRREPLRKTDAEVQRAVADALRYDPRLDPCAITVRAAEGAVTLGGAVENSEALGAAEEDARNAVGVEVVHNLLRVRPPQTKGIGTSDACCISGKAGKHYGR